MRRFTELFRRLDRSARTTDKLAALTDYFRSTPARDAAWAVWFLSGRRMKRVIRPVDLRRLVAEVCDLPLWLVEDSYEIVGDLGETLALLLDTQGILAAERVDLGLADLIESELLPLISEDLVSQRARLAATWRRLSMDEVFLLHKMITGGFRVGVARGLLTRALAAVADLDVPVMAQRLMGEREPTEAAYRALIGPTEEADQWGRPYPFFLAHAVDVEGVEALGAVSDWAIEYKWDGIRAQAVRRGGRSFLWSRGEEPLDDAFPELIDAVSALPDGVVLDGEILVWSEDGPAPFAALQRRLGRRAPDSGLLVAYPATFMAYDLLELEGQDRREVPWVDRRTWLADVVESWMDVLRSRSVGRTPATQLDLFEPESTTPRTPPLAAGLSPVLDLASWVEVGELVRGSRARRVEGVMLKRRVSPYGVGRARGAWWKWKVAPCTLDAVLVAAQLGHGRRANLYTDYTLAVWDGEALTPVAKAYSGLTDEEIDRVDAFVRANITGRFGPVRSVKPALVFELAFEGVQSSSRHKSGLALRFPRIQRWRVDLSIEDADTLTTAQGFL